jgi:hypothetical protein
VYEAPLTTVAPEGADERVGAALQQAMMQARDAGYEPLGDFETGPRRFALGRVEPIALELAAGKARCVRAYVLSTARSARAQLWVDGTPVDEPAAEGQAARFCINGDVPGAKPVQLRLWSNSADRGDAWLIVLAR